MRQKLFSVFILLMLMSAALAQSLKQEEGWEIFSRVKFTEKFFRDLQEHYLVPFFDSRIRAYEGKDFVLKGHFLPLDMKDERSIILSKHPYSMCFFCGTAGPESVVEVVFVSKRPKFKADQVITVKGILKLNDADVGHLNFILEEAELVAK